MIAIVWRRGAGRLALCDMMHWAVDVFVQRLQLGEFEETASLGSVGEGLQCIKHIDAHHASNRWTHSAQGTVGRCPMKYSTYLVSTLGWRATAKEANSLDGQKSCAAAPR